MKKIALIKTTKESDWVSCQSIVSNLELAYLDSNKDRSITVLRIQNENDQFEIYSIVKNIIKLEADEIAFIDHRPHPAAILLQLTRLAPEYRPVLTFHIFGDFVLQSALWYEINSILKSYKTNFVCASEKQKNLIDSFLQENTSTSITPFPLKKDIFFYDSHERNETRKSLGLNEEDFLFLYTGRISLQKNVLELTKAMANCSKILGENLYFAFVGPFDDLGTPYKGQENPPGAYFQRWVSIKQGLDQTKIKYLQNLDSQELRKVYNAADCFISLSTHNDEDFGMSPAEALMCGLPTVLTDWGGYSSFKDIGKRTCDLISVTHRHKRILPNLQQIQKIIYKKMSERLSHDERKNLAEKASGALSIKSVSEKISSRLEGSASAIFPGFNSHFLKLSSIFKANPQEPFRGVHEDYSDFYFETYKSYFKETLNE